MFKNFLKNFNRNRKAEKTYFVDVRSSEGFINHLVSNVNYFANIKDITSKQEALCGSTSWLLRSGIDTINPVFIVASEDVTKVNKDSFCSTCVNKYYEQTTQMV